MLSDRLTDYMNEHELSIGELCTRMPRRRKDIYRLQSILLGRTTPRPLEAAVFAKLLGLPEEQIRIESCLPGKAIRSLSMFRDVCDEAGLFREEPSQAPTPAEAPDPETESAAPAVSARETEATVPAVRQGARVEVRPGRNGETGRGITALEYGVGSLAFAAGDGSKAFVLTVRDGELAPVLEPESAVIVTTDGFDPERELTPGDFPGNGWYVLRIGRREVLRHVTAGADFFAVDCGNERTEETMLTLRIVGRAAAAVAAKVL